MLHADQGTGTKEHWPPQAPKVCAKSWEGFAPPTSPRGSSALSSRPSSGLTRSEFLFFSLSGFLALAERCHSPQAKGERNIDKIAWQKSVTSYRLLRFDHTPGRRKNILEVGLTGTQRTLPPVRLDCGACTRSQRK